MHVEQELSDDAWDALVARTDAIDRWCTSSAWAASAGEAFGSGPPTVLHNARPGVDATYAVMLRHEVSERSDGQLVRVVVGPDPVWGFASSIVGDVAHGAAAAAEYLVDLDGWDVAVFPGIEPGSATEHAIGEQLMRRFPDLRVGADAVRLVARLDPARAIGDDDPWLLRRSATLRRNLRRAGRAADSAGLQFEVIDGWDPAATMERLAAIESRSWKGHEGSGIAAAQMAAFCLGILRRLAPSARRVTVANLDRRDVGFILGGVSAFGYRGAQIAYTTDVAALSVGHLLQWHEIRRLARAGVLRYDLGMDIEYKHRFADERYVTRSLIIVR